MDPLRVAILPTAAARELRDDPNRGVLWKLVDVRDRPDYVLTLHDHVHEAIRNGDTETRSSIHLMTPDGDRGPLFLLGPRYPLAHMALDARERGDSAFLAMYGELHRRWMAMSWGTMLTRALELLAGGTLQVAGDVVWVDGAPGPCRMGDAPRECHDPETMLARGIPQSCPFIIGS